MGVALLATVLGAALAVRGPARCPTAAEVSEALATLAPSGPAPAAGNWAEIVDDGDGARVRLVQPDGTLLAEKHLGPGACRQQAETAAVVLAAWASELRSESELSFETPPPPPVAARPSIAAPAPPAAPERRRSEPLVLAAGAGVLASVEGDSVAPAASVEMRLQPPRSGWGAQLALRGTGTHRLTFGPGDAQWRRLSASAGVVRRQAWRLVVAEAGLAVVSGVLAVGGDGFTSSRSTRSWDFGFELGARIGLVLGRVEPWLGIALDGWLREQRLEVAGLSERDRLPSYETRLGIGASFTWGP